jgi:uncharacterized membrane protein YphA (DoxX/SURF4 family)
MLPSSRTYGFWLALVRIYTGIFWLEHGLGKLHTKPAFGAPGGTMATFLAEQAGQTTGFYHAFLTGTVIPNLSTFAYAVELGEMVAGALLLVGLFTRLGAFIGVVLALNYWLAKGGIEHLIATSSGVHGFAGFSGLEMCAAVLTAISLVLPTGRVLGIDGLAQRRPRPAPQATFRPVGPPPPQRP